MDAWINCPLMLISFTKQSLTTIFLPIKKTDYPTTCLENSLFDGLSNKTHQVCHPLKALELFSSSFYSNRSQTLTFKIAGISWHF